MYYSKLKKLNYFYQTATRIIWILPLFLAFIACNKENVRMKKIGFVDAFSDPSLQKARIGFYDALKQNGFSSEAGTLQSVYTNAEGSIDKLNQNIQSLLAQNVDLIATCPTIAAQTTIQATKQVPIFMMVSTTPEQMKVLDANGNPPSNLFGVAETQTYIDTSFLLISQILPVSSQSKIKVGLIYDSQEIQSVSAKNRLLSLANSTNIELVIFEALTDSDVKAILNNSLFASINCFFANPDNLVFSNFEIIKEKCNNLNVPIFSSEAGLVSRGAVTAFGADLYLWGFQTGIQAVSFLKTNSLNGLKIDTVEVRRKLYNPVVAQKFNLKIPAGFQPYSD